jgi:bifunctional DNA-binding transcriptional regulator/antitoxin component of YhaV-PrlF toxin-antitoxin module
MPKQPAKIQAGGRISIEADIRRELDVEPGDYVMIDVEPLSEANDE